MNFVFHIVENYKFYNIYNNFSIFFFIYQLYKNSRPANKLGKVNSTKPLVWNSFEFKLADNNIKPIKVNTIPPTISFFQDIINVTINNIIGEIVKSIINQSLPKVIGFSSGIIRKKGIVPKNKTPRIPKNLGNQLNILLIFEFMVFNKLSEN